MKTLLLALFLSPALFCTGFAQAVLQVEAPQNNGSTTQQRAPNGTANHAYMRACVLVLANELSNLPNGSSISNFGFTLQTGTSGTPVSGNFTLYLQNTNDLTYLKGTNWTTIPTGMTQVYASVMTIPLSAGTSSIMITLGTPFVYTGAGLYVAYDWICTGPYTAATIATYYAESAVLNPGCASGASASSSPTLLTTTNFRPSFLFQAANTNTNDIQVMGMEANGKVPVIFNQAQAVSALIKNASNQTNSNILVSLNVSGANTFATNLTISSLAAGAQTLVTFPTYTPLNVGLNTLSVSLNSDQNNSNNSKTFPQLVNCNILGRNPGAGSYTSGAVGYGAGSGILGMYLFNPVSSTLTGINFAVSNNTVTGGQVYGVLLNNLGTVIATTNTLTITAGMLGSFQEMYFNTPINLLAATNYVIGVAQMVVGSLTYYPAGTENSNYLPNPLYVTTPLGGGALTPLTQNFGYFGIEAIYQHSANVSISASSTLLCLGSSATLQATGAVNSYTWNSGSNAASIVVSPSSLSSYSVVATNSIGCRSRAVQVISVSPLPNVNASSPSASVCAGSTLILQASGASSYTWSTGVNSATALVSPTVNSSYTVTGANAAGCENSAQLNISVSEPIFSVSSNTFACGNNPVTLTVTGQGNYNYLWSNNFPFPSITVTLSSPSVFSVTASDANNCSKTLTVNVNVLALPTVSASANRNNICRNESITLNAGGALTYTWSNGATGNSTQTSFTSTGTFIYTVTGTDANTCSNTATLSIKVNACIGLEELKQQALFLSVFPNPGRDLIQIRLGETVENTTVQVLNLNGQLVLEQEVQNLSLSLNVSHLDAGAYLIRLLRDGQSLAVKKLLIE